MARAAVAHGLPLAIHDRIGKCGAVRTGDRRRVTGNDVNHEGWIVRGERHGAQRAAQLTHGRGGRQPVPHHISDRNSDPVISVERGGGVPITADSHFLSGGLIDHAHCGCF